MYRVLALATLLVVGVCPLSWGAVSGLFNSEGANAGPGPALAHGVGLPTDSGTHRCAGPELL